MCEFKMDKMALGKSSKLKISNGRRYYGTYLIYDVANSCVAALHAKVPRTIAGLTCPTNSPSSQHAQNPRK